MPILFNKYWYASMYIVILAFAPFLNVLIKALNKQQHLFLSMLMVFLFSALPSIQIEWISVNSSLPIFITMYIVGAYLGRYSVRGFSDNKLNIAGSLLIVGFMVCNEVVIKIAGHSFITYFTWSMSKITVIILSLLMFLSFERLEFSNSMKVRKLIIIFSSSTFGIYILRVGLHQIFFGMLFRNESAFVSDKFAVHAFGSVIIVFVLTAIIDLIVGKIAKPLVFVENRLIHSILSGTCRFRSKS